MKMNKETFNYTYSAGEQEEIRRIREKYQPRETDKMEQLRRLDESVTHKGTAVSVWVGIVGTLLMGFGMSCCMVLTDLFILGIIVGVIGIITLSLAYPLYNYITKKERERIAPEIIRLTDELLK
ncbi:MAG: hypothetical protein IJ045_00905 [Ruminiclostridium sp.]|nr:hypothetical protein [Ruminiclostridium sp.]